MYCIIKIITCRYRPGQHRCIHICMFTFVCQVSISCPISCSWVREWSSVVLNTLWRSLMRLATATVISSRSGAVSGHWYRVAWNLFRWEGGEQGCKGTKISNRGRRRGRRKEGRERESNHLPFTNLPDSVSELITLKEQDEHYLVFHLALWSKI